MFKLIAIVPRLPPAVDGVGDYGLALARKMQQEVGMVTCFIVGDRHWRRSDAIEFEATPLQSWSAKALLEQLPTDQHVIALLHYVGYGYAHRGCPVWLVKALEYWRSHQPRARLVTIFHELYATGPFWTSAFWTSPVQKDLAVCLSQLSDRCLTSKYTYAQQIQTLSNGHHQTSSITVFPVFSTVGEPTQVSPLRGRSPSLVTFGSRGPRKRVYQQREVLAQVCQALEITKIIDIGPPLEAMPLYIGSIPVRALGIQSAIVVSRVLSRAIAGFFDYPTAYLAKSTIFAAYCAHGTLPIGTATTANSSSAVDGLVAGQHYWLMNFDFQNLTLATAQRIATQAHQWYQTHTLSIQAHHLAKLLTQGLEL